MSSSILIFLIFLVIFGVIVNWLGVRARRLIKGGSDYIIAGREVNLLVNVFGVAAIGYAGTTLTLSPSFALMGGFWKGVAMLGIAYSVIGIGGYGLLVAPLARRSGAHTLPEWMEIRYDKRVRIVVAITAIISMIGITANNIVSVAYILAGFTNWNLLLLIVIAFLLFLGYVFASGLWGVAITDFFMGFLCIIGMPLLIVTLLIKYGGFNFIANNWPGGGSWLTSGITGGTFPWFSLKYPSFLVALFLYGFALVWGSNHYWIRCSSVRSERIARNSFLWAALILFLANGIVYVLVGSYAGAAHPTAFQPIGSTPTASAFGILLQELNPVIASYLLISTIAASISTATATHIAGSSMLIRDFYQRFFKPKATSKELITPSRIITLLFGVITLVLCFYPGGPVFLFAFSTAWLLPSGVALLLGMYWKRASSTGTFWGVFSGILLLSVWTILDLTKIYPMTERFGHMAIPGFLLTFIITIIISLLTPKKATKLEVMKEKIKLNELETKTLDLISKGSNVLCDISDILNVDSNVSNKAILKLEEYGLIRRKSQGGMDYYLFEVTEKGREFLPQLTKEDEILFQDGLSSVAFTILAYISNHKNIVVDDLVEITKLEPLSISAIIQNLIRQGYVIEGGLIRRKLRISDKGKGVVEKYKKLLNYEI
ncbi:sodium:solute symporter family protein [Petrotoga sp. 9PWA.NaAc.5.4]|uniref:sodium:solute symporter family transporter n=1 Tax=Petrotoga sp. 9PWA.NaAc.5.4 TaxID=1434328 RepID=UPI000CBF6B48|nr:sodium:solute symporter family protein [Petrotoga sp. 9PWA.NaAc.5.4]PNR92282.1 hypothetical protein X924_10265 [Petrotoga sp. 9PWA.NaAc.5.4]